jgi:hypothetical protein
MVRYCPTTPQEAIVRTFVVRRWGDVIAVRLNDFFHEMAVAIKVQDRTIVAVKGWTFKVPWSTCVEAPSRLAQLVGATLDSGTVRSPKLDASWQCTHLFDLARLAISLAEGPSRRKYVARIERLDDDERCARAILYRDDNEVLRWSISGETITAPALLRGHRLVGRSQLSPEILADRQLFDEVMMLRRAALIFRTRLNIGPDTVSAAEFSNMAGACYTFQPTTASRATRPRS